MFRSRLKNTESLLFFTLKRFKNGKDHWSTLRKKIHPTDKAMEHFNDFYGSTFGVKWDPIKKALIRRHKYVALVNNFGDDVKTMEMLDGMGARNMRDLFAAHKRYLENVGKYEDDEKKTNHESSQKDQIQAFAARASKEDIASLYPDKDSTDIPQILDTGGTVIRSDENRSQDEAANIESLAMRASLASSLAKADIDTSRIVEPEVGMSSTALWTFIPPTYLMGKDDWVPESHQYKYYTDAADFPLTIEKDEFTFPEKLNVFGFDGEDDSKFPEPLLGSTGVLNYYLMDGASILPVVALGLQPGDRVLDMCAAPGGKSLAILQTMLTDVLVANDYTRTRLNRITRVFREYLYDYTSSNKWRERIILKLGDGRHMIDEGFDKVLVDAPCTTDRHSLKVNDNNIFAPSRNKERLYLPELQSKLLSNALALCRVGGTVVYSTCSLSPIQNDAVVHLALKQAFEDSGIQATIKLFDKTIKPIQSMFCLGQGKIAARYGHLIVPDLEANYGPGYFAKLVRTK